MKELGAAGIVLGPNSLPIVQNVDCDVDDYDCDEANDIQQQLTNIPLIDPDVDICTASTVHLSSGCIPEETIVAPTDCESECAHTTTNGDIILDISTLGARDLIQESFSPCALNAESGSASDNSIITENNSRDVTDFMQHMYAPIHPHRSELSDTNINEMIEIAQTVSSSQSDISLDSLVDSRRDSLQVSSRSSSYSSECNVALERRCIGDPENSPLYKIRCIRDHAERDGATQYHTPMLDMIRSDVCTIVSLNDGDDNSSSNTDDDSLSVRQTDNICVSEHGNMKVAAESEHAILLIALASSVQ